MIENRSKTGIIMVKGSDKPKAKRMKFCDVPNCSGYALNDEIPLCRKHSELLEFFVWALNNVKISDKIDEIRTKSGLIIPK